MQADEFDAIEPQVVEQTIGGRVFRIAPITMDRLPAFARALRPILPTVGELLGIDQASDPQYVTDTLLQLVSEDGENLAEAVAVAVATSKDDIAASRAAVAKLDAASFLLLALPVIRVNADFFARRLLPVLLKAMQEAKAATAPTPGAGSTPSSA